MTANDAAWARIELSLHTMASLASMGGRYVEQDCILDLIDHCEQRRDITHDVPRLTYAEIIKEATSLSLEEAAAAANARKAGGPHDAE